MGSKMCMMFADGMPAAEALNLHLVRQAGKACWQIKGVVSGCR